MILDPASIFQKGSRSESRNPNALDMSMVIIVPNHSYANSFSNDYVVIIVQHLEKIENRKFPRHDVPSFSNNTLKSVVVCV